MYGKDKSGESNIGVKATWSFWRFSFESALSLEGWVTSWLDPRDDPVVVVTCQKQAERESFCSPRF